LEYGYTPHEYVAVIFIVLFDSCTALIGIIIKYEHFPVEINEGRHRTAGAGRRGFYCGSGNDSGPGSTGQRFPPS
jgi:hypothetical protein